MKLKINVLLIAAILMSCGNDDGPDICEFTDVNRSYKEEGGLLLLEAESTGIPDGWTLSNATEGFTGTGYLQWTGEEFLNDPGSGLLIYQLGITTTGTYRFQWRTRINEGNSSTENNDAWVRFSDANEFFGEKSDGSIVYPVGSDLTPNPNGQSKAGWFKVYQNQPDRWSYQASTSDDDPHDVFVTFNTPGTYTMEISGRSTGFAIDRIILNQDNPIDVTDPDLPVNRVDCEGLSI